MFIHSSIHHIFREHFYVPTVPGTVPGTGETAVNKTWSYHPYTVYNLLRKSIVK